MEFDAWLKDNGFDPAAVPDKARPKLLAQWKADLAGDGGGAAVAVTDYDAEAKRIAADTDRRNYIREASLKLMAEYSRAGDRAKVDLIKAEADKAMDDESVTEKDFHLQMVRLGRAPSVQAYAPAEGAVTGKIVEAAFCRRAALENLDKRFDARTLEASEKHFRNGLSLVGLLNHSAQQHGWRGLPDVQSKAFLQAAFGQTADTMHMDIRAGTTGPSTYSLPNILGNIANKFLQAGFLSVDNTWSSLAARRSVNDFKTVTRVRLNGATMYKALAPGGGEIKHAAVSETAYTNRASTYAIMIGVSREDLINDDVGAFTETSRHMGRGAGLKINDLFWTAFLNNSAFFTSGNSNVSTGGGSALGTADGAAINAAEVKFINQTDPNGYPIATAPRIMLVPPTLANTARRWMGSFGMVQSGTAGLGDNNVFQGRYTVLTSPYMESSTYTGNSTAAWYLLASPDDIPVIEGVALNGRWEPTVETADADFNQLGMAWRGYVDVGFSLYEYRGGVRSAGS